MKRLSKTIHRIGRVGLSVGVLVASWQVASADITAHCEGKYVHAVQLVDAAFAKYGTLYSGGHHNHRTDHVGATLDLYRLWRGLPDAGLRGANVVGIVREYDTSSESYWQQPSVAEVWARAKWAASEAELENLGEQDRAFAAQGFDRLTGIQTDLDGWREGIVSDPSKEGWPDAVALMAENSALDWMQSVAVASSADYALYWHLAENMSEEDRTAHKRIGAADWERFQAGEGIEWAVSAALHYHEDQELEGFAETLAGWGKTVLDCTATPAEYAALVTTQSVLGRYKDFAWRRSRDASKPGLTELLPPSVRSGISRSRAFTKILVPPRYCRQSDGALGLSAPVEDVMLALYAACEIEDVPLSDAAYAMRAYNLLSTDHLVVLGKRYDAPAGLVRAAFARHVALGNWLSAEDLVPDLMAATPAHAARIEREWTARGRPRPVRLARIILFTPNLSTMIASTEQSEAGINMHVWHALGGIDEAGSVRGTRNLQRDYVYGGIMQRDYEVMLRLPHRRGAFWAGRWGLTGPLGRATERQAIRGDHWRARRAPPIDYRRYIGRPGDRNGVPFVRELVAVEELRDLAGDAALMKTVSDVILDWSEAQTDSWWARRFGNHEADAEALAQLIALCRYNACGARAGTPQAKRAFKMLKGRMGKTGAAKSTKYWWNFKEHG